MPKSNFHSPVFESGQWGEEELTARLGGHLLPTYAQPFLQSIHAEKLAPSVYRWWFAFKNGHTLSFAADLKNFDPDFEATTLHVSEGDTVHITWVYDEEQIAPIGDLDFEEFQAWAIMLCEAAPPNE